MNDEPADRAIDQASQAYDAIVAGQLGQPGVALGRSLRNETLTTGGKIFAFRKDATLVVKLPAERVTALIAAGRAVAFQTGRAPMREWAAVALPADSDGGEAWDRLAAEARAYVSALPAPKRKSTRPKA